MLLMAQSSIAIATASAAGPRTRPDAAAGLAPTIHWEEARKHQRDRIPFTPGDRVSVGFRPRASDRWTIGGAKPRALPAGRLDGTGMRRQANGPIPRGSSTVDQPAVAPGTALTATAASWSAPDPPVRMELQAPVDPGALRREVFGFLPYWQVNASTLRIQYDKVSTIAYFGVGADAAGNLQKRNSGGTTTVGWSGWTSSRLTSIIDQAHATGTRVVLTVQSFAWNTSGKARQKALLGSWSARLNLARQIAAAVRDRGADGVNLDFEPIVSGASGQFTALVKTVRTELDKIHRGYQLTFDTTGSIGNYPIEAATASGGADAIFIMGYDYRGASSSPVGSVAPLTRSGYDIRDTVAAYTARVPASKLILGVPYYGRAWSTNSSAVHATNISGTRYGASTTVVYTSALPLFSAHGKRYDTGEQVAWTVYRRQNCTTTYGCVNPWRQLYIDDARSLGAKYDLVNRYGLRGAGIWALGYDGTQPELWGAIQNKFITDTVPPRITGGSLSTSVFSPNGDGTLDSTTARMTATGLVRWGYRVQAYVGSSLGPNLRSGTVADRTPAFAWNGMDSTPAVVADGRYRITLWAEDVSANRSERAFDVTVDRRRATVTSGATRLFVTPDGDGRTDTIRLAWTADEAVAGAVRVRATSGAIQRSWSFSARTGWSGSWDARTAAGSIVNDGRYTFQVDGRDRAGNRTVANQTIYVDRTIRSVRWSDPSFDPRAGQRSRIRVDLRRAATVTMRVYRGTTLVRSAGTDIAMSAGLHTWNWDGRSSTGTYVAPDTYKVVVWATSWVGTTWYSQNVVVETH
jgi:spore germination protein YaaH